MKVWEVEAGSKSLDGLKRGERADAKPGPGQVKVRVRAASLNARDQGVVRGAYRGGPVKRPTVPLSDGAGEVVEVGAAVGRVKPGDRVCGIFCQGWIDGTFAPEMGETTLGSPLDGMLAEYAILSGEGVVKFPPAMSFEQAATLPCAAVTAWSALIEQGGLRAGQTVLLQGTGGVSLFALQFAKLHGAEVILTSSSDAKLARAEALGADHLINYRTEPDWHERARAITDGRGVDQVVEVGGAATLERSIAALRPSGTISLIGVLGGNAPTLPLGRVVTRNLRLQGVTVGSRDTFEAMVRAMEVAGTRPVLDERRFAIEDLGQALAALPEGRHFGKVVGEL